MGAPDWVGQVSKVHVPLKLGGVCGCERVCECVVWQCVRSSLSPSRSDCPPFPEKFVRPAECASPTHPRPAAARAQLPTSPALVSYPNRLPRYTLPIMLQPHDVAMCEMGALSCATCFSLQVVQQRWVVLAEIIPSGSILHAGSDVFAELFHARGNEHIAKGRRRSEFSQEPSQNTISCVHPGWEALTCGEVGPLEQFAGIFVHKLEYCD